MSEIRCRRCDGSFDGRSLAWCPGCLAAGWLATPDLVRPKHDPLAPASPQDRYRSLITPRTRDELPAVLADAALRGRWFWDRDYGMWVHVTERPLGRNPGVGVPAGREQAEHALDCLFVAEADSAVGAHVFAVDGERHRAQVRAGVFRPLGACGDPDGCENLTRPGAARCEAHEPALEPATAAAGPD